MSGGHRPADIATGRGLDGGPRLPDGERHEVVVAWTRPEVDGQRAMARLEQTLPELVWPAPAQVKIDEVCDGPSGRNSVGRGVRCRQTGSRIQKRVPPPLRGSNPIDP
jgi:hypothetical protein